MSAHQYQDDLLRQCFDAIARNDFEAAEELADRLRRSAPASADLIVTQSKILMLRQKPLDAVRLLDRRDVLDRSPSACTLLLTANSLLGNHDEALRIAQFCLRRFAIDALADPRSFEHLCQALGADVGWVGLRGDGFLEMSLPAHVVQLPRLVAAGHQVRVIGPHPTADTWRRYRSSRSLQDLRSIRVVSEPGTMIGPDRIEWPASFDIQGQVVTVDRRVSASAVVGWLPVAPVTFVLRDELHSVTELTGTLIADGFDRKRTVLDIDPHSHGIHGNRVDVTILLPDGTECALPGSPVRRSRALSMIPPRHGLPHPVPSLAHSSSTSNRPTLVIPISATAGVLAGILAWIESLDFDAYGPRIIVIAEQAVPADALERVRQLTRASSTFLLEVAGRGDLAALLNAATAHAAPAHVLICIPPYYPDLAWITRFADAAMSERRAGIMHALPNAGEHPFWTPITPTASPDSRDWTEARSIAASVNKSMRPEAYGFFARCFYVGRQCLEQVGGFDAGDQSSEEFIVEDFAMRAHRGGWATVVAADVLAPAMESTTRQPARLLRSRDALERRYPGYTDQAERPLPLLQAQRRIEEARLSEAAARPAILFVTLALGGGVARRVREEIAATRNAGFRAIQLKPNSMRGSEGWCELAVDDRFESPLEYLLPLEIDQLRSFLKSIGVVEVLIHHILGLPPVVLDIPALLSVPFKIIIHDYIWFCPRTNLIRDDRYCNEPDVTECNACVQAHGSFLEPGLSPESLRHRSLKLFERAAQVIVPSADTAARMHRHFPTLQTLTSAWEVVPPPLATPYEASRASLKKKIRVAVIGSIGIQKGFNLLEAAAKDAAQNDLPIEFVVVGHSFDDARLANTGRIAVTGEFLEPEIDTMLRGVACDIAFFPSIWPETWCYALTHAMRAGLPILASSLGAFRERLTNYPDAGFFDPASATPHQINCQLIELARKLCDWLDPRGQDASPAAEELSDAVRPSGIGLGEVETNPRSAVVTSQSVVPVSDTGRPALTSTVQVLSLAEGIYAFTVRGSATSAWRENEILVPAIRILPAPFAKQKARLTILSSPAAVDDWLTKPGDVVVAQITGGTAHLLLTSLSLPNTIPLSIDVRKLDQPAEIALPRPQEAPPPVRSAPAPVTSEPQPRTSIPQAAIQAPEVRSPATAATSQRKMLRAQILAHIQNRGDVPFVGGAWAGFLGQRLWIEAFAITLLEGPGKDALEYKGRTAGGFETPWLSNGAWCGTRGMGVPLIEFALRLKPQLALTHECEYSGSFFSGAVVGPTREGLPCRSATANDPLEAIQIRLTERAVPGGLSAGSYIASAAP